MCLGVLRCGGGWMLAKETLVRVGKLASKTPRLRKAVAEDPRVLAVIALLEEALTQGVMDSSVRLGRMSDDLTAVAGALKALGMTTTPLYTRLVAKIDQEDRDQKREWRQRASDPGGGSGC
mmetsp:Transcript_95121/g.254205  ORF Transcript_95121/g.254205 Transcript_95121/m.254205 type:complete len:121 (-) Transcript_95121:261-623(-)